MECIVAIFLGRDEKRRIILGLQNYPAFFMYNLVLYVASLCDIMCLLNFSGSVVLSIRSSARTFRIFSEIL